MMRYVVMKQDNPVHKIDVSGETVFSVDVNSEWEIVTVDYSSDLPVTELLIRMRKKEACDDKGRRVSEV